LLFSQFKSKGKTSKYWILAGFLSLGLGLSPLVVAVDASNSANEPVEEVTITASRAELQVQKTPYAIYSLSSNVIAEDAPRNLPEALTRLPGVNLQKTANGQGSPFIRGFTGYRTLMLIDGVRYNNSVYRDGPSEYFSLIDSHTIGQIDLINGPGSVLYGSDAIGGTLSLNTRVPSYLQESEAPYLNAEQLVRFASAEHSQLSRTEVDLGRGKVWGLRLGLSLKKFGDVETAQLGKQAHTGYDESAYDLRFDTQINAQWQLHAAHQHLAQDDVWRTHTTVYAQPFLGTSIGSDLQNSKDQARELSYLKLIGNELGIIEQVQLTFSEQNWREEALRIRSNAKQQREFFDSTMQGFDLQFASNSTWGKWVYGLDAYADNLDSGRADYLANGALEKIRIQGPIGDDARFNQAGLFVQLNHYVTPRIELILGSRKNWVSADIGIYEDPVSKTAASYQQHWDASASSLRLSWDATGEKSTYLWGGLSQSFRAPNIADLSRYGTSRSTEFEVAAERLTPETYLTYELGLKQIEPHYYWNMNYYYTDISDYIASTPTGNLINGLTEVTKKNAASGYMQGLEFAANYELNGAFSIFSVVNWLHGELDMPSASSTYIEREPFSRSMPRSSQWGIEWHSTASETWAKLIWQQFSAARRLSTADKEDTERIPAGGTPAYHLVSFRAGTTFWSNTQLTLGLENILDEIYRTHGSGSNEPGVGLNVSLKFTY
jgi:hemoglobin/transferrin/lactoferrin receptor protein